MLITLLTGRRPLLLARTLDSLRGVDLGEFFMLVLHNGADRPTAEVLEAHRDRIDLVITTPQFLDIGEASSLLFKHAQEMDMEYLLHLEDDWEAGPFDLHLPLAQVLLDRVFQVRLRYHKQKVLKDHMVTGRPIKWVGHPGYRITNDAHYTLNPALIRLSDIGKGFPALDEKDAQRRFWVAGCRQVAQLPGVWRHIGGGLSLR
jgi:hypothetical protein